MQLKNYLCLLLFPLIMCCQKQVVSSGKMVLETTNLVVLTDSCNCEVKTYKLGNFSVIEKYPGYPCRVKFVQEKKAPTCSSLTLMLNNRKVALDSIYYANIQNKEVAYLPGYIKGHYTVNNGIYILTLQYLNEAINSSKPTTHTYTITYDIRRDSILKEHFVFDEEL
jgi:hypothetical protein